MPTSARFIIGVLALGAGALRATVLAAQSSSADSGTFVIRHASDTVAVEHFARTATTLNGTLAVRNSTGTAQVYKAVVAPDASVPLIEVTVQETRDGGKTRGRVVERARIIFKEDSAAVDALTNRGLETRLFGTKRGAVPYLNLSFALLEQAVRRSRAVDPGGASVPLFNLGGGQTVDGRVSSLGADSLALSIGTVEFHLRVDGSGRVLGGCIPAQGVVVDRLGS